MTSGGPSAALSLSPATSTSLLQPEECRNARQAAERSHESRYRSGPTEQRGRGSGTPDLCPHRTGKRRPCQLPQRHVPRIRELLNLDSCLPRLIDRLWRSTDAQAHHRAGVGHDFGVVSVLPITKSDDEPFVPVDLSRPESRVRRCFSTTRRRQEHERDRGVVDVRGVVQPSELLFRRRSVVALPPTPLAQLRAELAAHASSVNMTQSPDDWPWSYTSGRVPPEPAAFPPWSRRAASARALLVCAIISSPVGPPLQCQPTSWVVALSRAGA